ncbi:hypothetical protein [Thalassomonas actiniarum]|uniref:Uncharacterized protein n=1 Tax=Thalassomonas actiniarum TaxID=485447 RepID=A0AAE9YRM1_9GAMM|nr:hypothetical protein [Thalassomonas actiniarum]WDD99616.1 hypothetical protein SG35_002775 [Thalassomonas actiniarum]
MEILSANEAKTKFGDMLMKVQRAPVQASEDVHDGKTVDGEQFFHELESGQYD